MSAEGRYVPAAGLRGLTRFYDSIVALTMRERLFRGRLGRQVLADLPDGARVADVGAGTGTFAIALATRAPGVEVIGIDGDREVLDIARAKRGSAAVEWRPGSAGELPLDDRSCDRIVMSLLLHHLDAAGKRAALAECHRVLRPEGRLHVADWGRPRDPLMRACLGQSVAGAEVSPPQRFRIKANWKIGAENFAGDTYHTPHTHASVVDINLFSAPKARKRKEGALYFADVGGGTTYKLPTTDMRENLGSIGYPPEMVERMEEAWDPQHRLMVGEAGFMPSAATVIPNLSFVHNWPIVDEEGLVVPFISMRQWQPVSATETEVLSWFVVDRAAPDWYKAASYKAYLMCFGSSGMFEQDDVENWTSITQMAGGQMARRLNLHSRMGLTRGGETVTAPIDWPAPGRAFTGFGEYNQRDLLGLWCDLLEDDSAIDDARLDGNRAATVN